MIPKTFVETMAISLALHAEIPQGGALFECKMETLNVISVKIGRILFLIYKQLSCKII